MQELKKNFSQNQQFEDKVKSHCENFPEMKNIFEEILKDDGKSDKIEAIERVRQKLAERIEKDLNEFDKIVISKDKDKGEVFNLLNEKFPYLPEKITSRLGTTLKEGNVSEYIDQLKAAVKSKLIEDAYYLLLNKNFDQLIDSIFLDQRIDSNLKEYQSNSVYIKLQAKYPDLPTKYNEKIAKDAIKLSPENFKKHFFTKEKLLELKKIYLNEIFGENYTPAHQAEELNIGDLVRGMDELEKLFDDFPINQHDEQNHSTQEVKNRFEFESNKNSEEVFKKSNESSESKVFSGEIITQQSNEKILESIYQNKENFEFNDYVEKKGGDCPEIELENNPYAALNKKIASSHLVINSQSGLGNVSQEEDLSEGEESSESDHLVINSQSGLGNVSQEEDLSEGEESSESESIENYNEIKPKQSLNTIQEEIKKYSERKSYKASANKKIAKELSDILSSDKTDNQKIQAIEELAHEVLSINRKIKWGGDLSQIIVNIVDLVEQNKREVLQENTGKIEQYVKTETKHLNKNAKMVKLFSDLKGGLDKDLQQQAEAQKNILQEKQKELEILKKSVNTNETLVASRKLLSESHYKRRIENKKNSSLRQLKNEKSEYDQELKSLVEQKSQLEEDIKTLKLESKLHEHYVKAYDFSVSVTKKILEVLTPAIAEGKPFNSNNSKELKQAVTEDFQNAEIQRLTVENEMKNFNESNQTSEVTFPIVSLNDEKKIFENVTSQIMVERFSPTLKSVKNPAVQETENQEISNEKNKSHDVLEKPAREPDLEDLATYTDYIGYGSDAGIYKQLVYKIDTYQKQKDRFFRHQAKPNKQWVEEFFLAVDGKNLTDREKLDILFEHAKKGLTRESGIKKSANLRPILGDIVSKITRYKNNQVIQTNLLLKRSLNLAREASEKVFQGIEEQIKPNLDLCQTNFDKIKENKISFESQLELLEQEIQQQKQHDKALQSYLENALSQKYQSEYQNIEEKINQLESEESKKLEQNFQLQQQPLVQEIEKLNQQKLELKKVAPEQENTNDYAAKFKKLRELNTQIITIPSSKKSSLDLESEKSSLDLEFEKCFSKFVKYFSENAKNLKEIIGEKALPIDLRLKLYASNQLTLDNSSQENLRKRVNALGGVEKAKKCLNNNGKVTLSSVMQKLADYFKENLTTINDKIELDQIFSSIKAETDGEKGLLALVEESKRFFGAINKKLDQPKCQAMLYIAIQAYANVQFRQVVEEGAQVTGAYLAIKKFIEACKVYYINKNSEYNNKFSAEKDDFCIKLDNLKQAHQKHIDENVSEFELEEDSDLSSNDSSQEESLGNDFSEETKNNFSEIFQELNESFEQLEKLKENWGNIKENNPATQGNNP